MVYTQNPIRIKKIKMYNTIQSKCLVYLYIWEEYQKVTVINIMLIIMNFATTKAFFPAE